MDYRAMLENGYEVLSQLAECPPRSRLEYLGDYIFEFATDDEEMSELFALKAVEVCEAINEGKTFEYIEDADNYRWYLLMCNMPFFVDRIEWGTSIRGAWWISHPLIVYRSCGLWLDGEQVVKTMQFDHEEWEEFIDAIIEFSRKEVRV